MAKRVEVVDKDRGWRAVQERARKAQASYVKVGVLSDASSGGLHEGSNLTVGEIAAVQEFGTEDGHVPARPFLRPTFDRERERLAAAARPLLEGYLAGEVDLTRALGTLGAMLATAVRATIVGGVPPPNAPSTLLRKANRGRTARFFRSSATSIGKALAQVGVLASIKPLIDTGRMLGAVAWSVVIGGGSKETSEDE